MSRTEELTDQEISEMIRWLKKNVPTGLDRVDRAWNGLREDRPHVEPLECPLTRALVKDQYGRIKKLRNQ